ncbi:nitroreductase family protein [Novosphingobium bradum]|uniref:Nitroreductase family protein n=1 Tax=Novosphingobium bradum TaxID=1737444 RepID=A0ABV7IMY6_9SPHN
METRQANPRVMPLFVERWSPRAFDGSAIPRDDLDVILQAAALAPSAFNYQPWRFLYAHREDANWDLFLSLLIPFNASWAKAAGALVVILSDSVMQQGEAANPSHSHSFDAGAAWAQMALQATALGYHAHGMTGIDFDRVRTELAVPESFRIEAAVAIGRRGAPDLLPEGLRERELPSGRKPLSALAHAGPFAPTWLGS